MTAKQRRLRKLGNAIRANRRTTDNATAERAKKWFLRCRVAGDIKLAVDPTTGVEKFEIA